MQPQASGSGWGAPGRAMQQLGKSIASLGDVFDGLGQEQIAEQDFQDKMLMLKTDNELGLNQVETHASYQGNGDDYLPQRTEYYATTTNDAVSRMQPRNQQKAALFFEQRRGPYLARDATFGGKRRQETLIGTINDTVSTEYGKLATVPPEEFEQRFNETLSGVDAIIRSAPLPDSLKDKLAGQAAERGYQVLNGLAEDPETAPEIVPKILKMIEDQPEEIDGGALEEVPAQPKKGAEGVQGLPGGPSGSAPQRTSALEIQDFTAGRTNYRPLPAQNVKNIVLHDVSGNPKTRRLPSGGNIPHYHITFDDKGIYHEIPFDRQAPHARAFNKDSIGIAYIGFEGDKLSPQAVANGARAVQMVQQQFGIPAERILTHPGAGPSATKSGKDPREAAWRGEVLAYLGQGGAEVADAGRPVEASAVNQRGLVQYAGLGGPKEEEVGAPREQNKIPAEPQLVQRPQLVREGVQVADASGRFVPQQPRGMIERGNIDINRRAVVRNADGSISTERSFSIGIDGREYLIPQVVNGKVVSEREAIEHFRKTGEHLGVFTDPKSASAYANSLHERQGQYYGQQKQSWRSVNSHLRDLLIKNSAHLKRQMLEAETKQDQKTKATLRAYRDKLTTEGFDLMYSGKLTREWVEESKDFLTPEKYGQFLKHISGTGTARTDPETYLDLMDRIEDEPEAVIAEAREHYLDKTLTKGDFDSLTRKANRQLNPDTSLPAWARDLKGMLKEQTAPHGFASLDRISRAIDARRAWDGYVEEKLKSGKLDPNDLKKYTLDAITAFRQRRAVETKQTLPVPQAWTQSSGDGMTIEEVDAATQKLLQALNLELATAGDDPVARKAITEKYAPDAALLQKWKRVLQDEALAKGEKLPPPSPPMKLGGPKPEQGTVNQQTPQSQGVPGYPGSQSGKAPARQQPQQGESRPVGGALGVVPLAENPDGSVSLSVPGMILEPWRAFQRGLERESVRGMTDEAGNPLYDPKAQSEDAMTAASVPLAATSFGSAVGAVPKGALGSGMVRAGETAAAKEISPQGFYSGLDEALKGFNPTDSVTAETLAKRGVKKAEIEARGLSELLSEGKSAKVSDLQRVAGENRVEVREKDYGANGPEFDALQMKGAELRERIDALRASGRDRERSLLGNGKTVDELEAEWSAMNARWREMDAASPKSKWSTYSLDPSNPTYRETVLHLPPSGPKFDPSKVKIERRRQSATQGSATISYDGKELLRGADDSAGHPDAYWVDYAKRTFESGDQYNRIDNLQGNFQSGHWSEPNVIAHARTSIQKDAQGNDVFVVNELQSDWGQKLRDGGVRDEAKIAELRGRTAEANDVEKGIVEDLQSAAPDGDRIKTSTSDARDRLSQMSAKGDPIGLKWKDAWQTRQLLNAELRTAEAAASGHPLVNTTDQWVNTGLRRMITQAVESGADQIAIPSGDTVKAFGMGGQESGLKYAYDEMYPKNLKNILKKLDPSIEPQKINHLFGQKGQKLERSKGFTVFKITPKLREAIKKEGQPLFSGGVPIDGEESD